MAINIRPEDLENQVVVRADISAVERILFNLIDNACKYALAGREKGIDITVGQQGGNGVIAVRDYGPGIGSDDLKRLFQPFSKSAKDAAESAPGVGLGLSISRRLARNMSGDLVLNRSVTGGACFELILPVARES